MPAYQDIEDNYLPIVPKPYLQQYDNYQIYSLVCCDYPVEITYLRKSRVDVVSGDNSPTYFYYYVTKGFDNSNPIIYSISGEVGKAIAYQRFSTSKIPINFDKIAEKLNVKPRDHYGYRYRVSTETLASYSDNLANAQPTSIDLIALWNIHVSGDSHDVNPYNYIAKSYNETFPRQGEVGVSTTNRYFTHLRDTSVIVNVQIPRLDMFAAIGGYSGDPRISAIDYPLITPIKNSRISISYYRPNPNEPIPNITSLDWHIYHVDLVKGKSIHLPLISPVFGSLIFEGDSEVISDIKSQLVKPTSNRYQWADYYSENIDRTVNEWKSIYSAYPSQSPAPSNLNVFGKDYLVYSEPIQRVVEANNNYWRNDFNIYNDINFNLLHQLFVVINSTAYDRHIELQADGSYGSLIMDSPRTIEIHTALNAGKWAINPDDPTKPRKDDLGWRIQRTNEVLGIRVKTDGTIDEPLEKKQNRREHAEGTERNNLQEYNPNCFGSKGMLVRYLPNKFKPKGKDIETIEGGFRKVKDIPQLLAELHEQANAAMGYQEGTAIEIIVDDETYRYPNQLALLTEIFVTLKQSGTYSKGAFFSSVVAEQSIKEVIGGLGLRTVDKYLEFKIAGKTAKLYYKGISASQSIRRKLSAISTNIGTIIGNIT